MEIRVEVMVEVIMGVEVEVLGSHEDWQPHGSPEHDVSDHRPHQQRDAEAAHERLERGPRHHYSAHDQPDTACAHTRTHMHIDARTRAYTHTHTHTHIYAHTVTLLHT